MLHALTQVAEPIALDTDSETEVAPTAVKPLPGAEKKQAPAPPASLQNSETEVAPTAVKPPPGAEKKQLPAPPASLQKASEAPAVPAAAPSEADVWKAKYEELKLLLEQKQAVATPASPAVASPPVAKPVFSPSPVPSPAEAAAPNGGEAVPKGGEASSEITSEEEAKRLAACDLSREELSPHALYMRLRRLCTPTGTGRLQVSQDVADQWSAGNREELQLALVMALKQHGYDDTAAVRKLVRVGQGCQKKTKEFLNFWLSKKFPIFGPCRRNFPNIWCAFESIVNLETKFSKADGSQKNACGLILNIRSSSAFVYVFFLSLIFVPIPPESGVAEGLDQQDQIVLRPL